MAAPPNIHLVPGDWLELERIINEMFRILNIDTSFEEITEDIDDIQTSLALLDDVAGAEGDVQYNKASGHGAEATFNYNDSTNLLNLQGAAQVTRLLAGGVQS